MKRYDHGKDGEDKKRMLLRDYLDWDYQNKDSKDQVVMEVRKKFRDRIKEAGVDDFDGTIAKWKDFIAKSASTGKVVAHPAMDGEDVIELADALTKLAQTKLPCRDLTSKDLETMVRVTAKWKGCDLSSVYARDDDA